jgi:hypothetical protein
VLVGGVAVAGPGGGGSLVVDVEPEPQPPVAAAQPGRGVLGNQAPGLEDGDLVGELGGLLQVLGGEEDGAAVVA